MSRIYNRKAIRECEDRQIPFADFAGNKTAKPNDGYLENRTFAASHSPKKVVST